MLLSSHYYLLWLCGFPQLRSIGLPCLLVVARLGRDILMLNWMLSALFSLNCTHLLHLFDEQSEFELLLFNS